MSVYVGIDPGVGGAFALVFANGDAGVWDTPVATVKGSRRDYLVAEMAGLLTRAAVTAAAIEQGIAMPRQSSHTTYVTGRGGGLWEGMLAALGIPYELVRAQDWKKALGIPPGSNKGASRVLASRLFPKLASQLRRVSDDGRAEALLIAEYRRRLG